MQIQPRITFHNMDPSSALKERIMEKISKLENKFAGIIGCYVVIEAINRHQHQGIIYSVRVNVTVPGGDLVVSEHPGKNPTRHEEPYAAMNDAFLAIDKQL